MPPLLILQAGAGPKSMLERQQKAQASLESIVRSAFAHLEHSGALAAVVEATRQLEDNPLFNAGTGSKLQVDGGARLSASLMDGQREHFSGVINVPHLANPILLARHLLEEEDRVLAGQGALDRARELNLEEKDVRTPASIERWKKTLAKKIAPGKTGTVGAVAVDSQGHIAAATSTGGRGCERVGRVSDSATIAANFATGAGGISFTGIGEHIVDGALGVRWVTDVENGCSAEEARDRLVSRMQHKGWEAGFVACDALGKWVFGHTTPSMYWAVLGPDGLKGFWNA